MTDKRVLTIQDISCMGQCSLTVALPIISACGVETVILPSAVLSTHTGCFTGYTFRDLTEDIPGIIQHWKQEGQTFDCLYTGYLGSVRQIDYVYDLKREVIKEEGLLIVDPAMADFGSLYDGFDQKFVDRMADLCADADIILPNLTEACLLTGMEMKLYHQDEAYVRELLKRLAGLGSRKIVLKGISYQDDQIGAALYDSRTEEVQYSFTDKIDQRCYGTGDCYASAFTGAIMQGRDLKTAADIAGAFVLESIRKTMDDEGHIYGVKFEKALPILVRELNT